MAEPAVLLRRLSARVSELPPGVAPAGTAGVILDAALRLFAERGFAGTSIRDVARAAQVQSATLYSHYRSKEHLLAEIVRIGHEIQHRAVRQALLNCEPDSRAQLDAYVRAHVRMHTDYPTLAVVANSERHLLSESLGGPAMVLREQSVELLIEIIQRGVGTGAFDVPHVWLAAAAIGGMGIRVAEWFTPDFELDAEDVARTYARFALRLVGAR